MKFNHFSLILISFSLVSIDFACISFIHSAAPRSSQRRGFAAIVGAPDNIGLCIVYVWGELVDGICCPSFPVSVFNGQNLFDATAAQCLQ